MKMNNKKNFVFLHSKEPSVCIFPSNVSFSLVNEFPLSHTFKQKSAFFDSIFAKYIYIKYKFHDYSDEIFAEIWKSETDTRSCY